MADLISADEIARLMEAFTVNDKDKDGLISTTELGHVLHTLGQNPTEAELQDLAYAMDTNESGTIDFPGNLNYFDQIIRYKRLLQQFTNKC